MNARVPPATSFANPPFYVRDGVIKPSSRCDSVASTRAVPLSASRLSSVRKELSKSQSVSSRPFERKSRRIAMNEQKPAKESNIKRWDGNSRTATSWDGLRSDPELWYPNGNCLIHLYARGTSRRGPAFRIPFEFIARGDCDLLLGRFLAGYNDSPVPGSCSNANRAYSNFKPNTGIYELYIPSSAAAQRDQSKLYHLATRNFFAWICGLPLVGESLGGALVGLLHSMNEFRSPNVDNITDVLEYMEDSGYADLRNCPDHALALLYFAEHFQFDKIYLDAFAHAVGMYEDVFSSPEYENIPRPTRSLLTRAHLELRIRLHSTSISLSSLLFSELSPVHLGLTAAPRAHLDDFRDFLHTHFVWLFGMYPPVADSGPAFPKPTLLAMKDQFHNLYDYLVDESFTASDSIPGAAQGGICVLQSVREFDARHRYESLLHPLPLLPELSSPYDNTSSRSLSRLSRRLTWSRMSNKGKRDERLLTLTALSKASNRHKPELLACPLVRAYREFEKATVFADADEGGRKGESAATKRKVRWILVYTMLQTLVSVTEVPAAVRDMDVDYPLCAQTAGCPPWRYAKSSSTSTLLRARSRRSAHPSGSSSGSSNSVSLSMASTAATSPTTASPPPGSFALPIEPDIDYTSILSRVPSCVRPFAAGPLAKTTRSQSLPEPPPTLSRRATVRRALSCLGNMPVLQHPKPLRGSCHGVLAKKEEDAEGEEKEAGLEAGLWMGQVEKNRISSSRSGGETPRDGDREGTLKKGASAKARRVESRWSESSTEAEREGGVDAKERRREMSLGGVGDGQTV